MICVRLVACVFFLMTGQAFAQAPTAAPAPNEKPPAVNTGIWERPNLLGDVGALRTRLSDAGITANLVEQSDLHGNSSGGLKQGATYGGLTTLTVQLDTEKAGLWAGGLFNISGLQIHGRNLSQYYLGTLQTSSGIEALPTTRLWEIWYQHTFLNGAFDVKLGQQSVDQEFMTSSNSAIFVNTSMGWPLLPSVDMYAGGPAYPLSSLGIRFRGTPANNVTLLGGVFQDNPPGGPFANDSQLRGSARWGGNFNLRTGALFIAEAQYALNQPLPPGAPADAAKPTGLPTSLKLGAWYDTAGFPDQRLDTGGIPLASPASNGNPKLRDGNYSVYGMVDQGIWRPAPDSPMLLSLFARAMGSTGDRNQVDFSVNGGVTVKALIPGREDDTLGVGFGVGSIGSSARQADRDRIALGGPSPVRSNETFIEVTYQAQVTPWLQVQPDFQYVIRPAGGVPNPYNPARRLGDTAVFGVRSSLTF
jgi:porin